MIFLEFSMVFLGFPWFSLWVFQGILGISWFLRTSGDVLFILGITGFLEITWSLDYVFLGFLGKT